MPRRKVVPIEPPQFMKMRQNKEVNKLGRMLLSEVVPKSINMLGQATIKDGNTTVRISGYNLFTRNPDVLTRQCFDILMLHMDNTGLASIPIDEYMGLRGKVDVKQTIDQTLTAMAHLRGVEIEVFEGNRLVTHAALYGGYYNTKKDMIEFRFTPEFVAMLPSDMFMEYPTLLLRVNPRLNPWSYSLGRKLAEHKRINITDGKNGGNSISVKSLLEACSDFPNPSKTRHIKEKIIEPFERDMNALKEMLSWQYRDGKPKDYREFISSMIDITWNDYPEISIADPKTKIKTKPKITKKNEKDGAINA